MIRPILTEIAIFLAPFAIYALYLLTTRADVLDRASWTPRVLGWLIGIALALMIASFIIFAHFTGAPPGATYEPAHLENGKFVPGRTR